MQRATIKALFLSNLFHFKNLNRSLMGVVEQTNVLVLWWGTFIQIFIEYIYCTSFCVIFKYISVTDFIVFSFNCQIRATAVFHYGSSGIGLLGGTTCQQHHKWDCKYFNKSHNSLFRNAAKLMPCCFRSLEDKGPLLRRELSQVQRFG